MRVHTECQHKAACRGDGAHSRSPVIAVFLRGGKKQQIVPVLGAADVEPLASQAAGFFRSSKVGSAPTRRQFIATAPPAPSQQLAAGSRTPLFSRQLPSQRAAAAAAMGEPVSLNSLSPQELVQARCRRRLSAAIDRPAAACLLLPTVRPPTQATLLLWRCATRAGAAEPGGRAAVHDPERCDAQQHRRQVWRRRHGRRILAGAEAGCARAWRGRCMLATRRALPF